MSVGAAISVIVKKSGAAALDRCVLDARMRGKEHGLTRPYSVIGHLSGTRAVLPGLAARPRGGRPLSSRHAGGVQASITADCVGGLGKPLPAAEPGAVRQASVLAGDAGCRAVTGSVSNSSDLHVLITSCMHFSYIPNAVFRTSCKRARRLLWAASDGCAVHGPADLPAPPLAV